MLEWLRICIATKRLTTAAPPNIIQVLRHENDALKLNCFLLATDINQAETINRGNVTKQHLEWIRRYESELVFGEPLQILGLHLAGDASAVSLRLCLLSDASNSLQHFLEVSVSQHNKVYEPTLTATIRHSELTEVFQSGWLKNSEFETCESLQTE